MKVAHAVLLSATALLGLCTAAIPQEKQIAVENAEIVTTVYAKGLPFKLTAPKGGKLYYWSHASNLKSRKRGRTCEVTAAPAGTHTFEVTIGYEQEENSDEPNQETLSVTVIVGKLPGPKPGPDPEPEPEPKPDPDKPYVPPVWGEMGLTKASYDGFATIKSKNRLAEAKAMAAANRTHAAAVAAGRYPSATKILEGWRESNRSALGNDDKLIAEWASWGAVVKKQVDALLASKTIAGNNEWAAAFNEIADGLAPLAKSKKGGK
jgi:hypothetical protein